MSENRFKPHSQKQFDAIMSDKLITLLGTGIQYGKALKHDEKVLTPTGYRLVSEIAVGDTLFDRDGKPTKVVGVYPQGVRDCYDITTTDGKKITTDGEHLNVILLQGSEHIITTTELAKGYDGAHIPLAGGTYSKIKSVEPAGQHLTVCFEVDSPTKTFIAGDQVVTHNTTVGALRLKIAMHKFTEPDDNFIMIAPNYKIMQQSCLPAFLKIMDGLGTYSKVDACFKMYGGGTCYMRTATDPDAIVGITKVRHIWGDEAGLFSLYAWENMQARASFYECPITLTTSPYSLNWVFRELIKQKDKRDDLLLVQARSDENPYFPKAEFERKRAQMAPSRFNMVYGGNWEKMEGLVYDVFSEDRHIVEPFTMPVGTRFKAGIDWGYSHPFVLKVRAITPEGIHYDVDEVCRTGLTIIDIVKLCKAMDRLWGIDTFYCGPDRPENIKELCRNGLSAVPANNDVKHGCDLHYQLIKSGKYYVFKDKCPHTVDEYGMYHWPTANDLGVDQDDKERNPVKQFDDSMDATRYVTASTYHLSQAGGKRAARVPQGEGQRVVSKRTKPRIGAHPGRRQFEEFS